MVLELLKDSLKSKESLILVLACGENEHSGQTDPYFLNKFTPLFAAIA